MAESNQFGVILKQKLAQAAREVYGADRPTDDPNIRLEYTSAFGEAIAEYMHADVPAAPLWAVVDPIVSEVITTETGQVRPKITLSWQPNEESFVSEYNIIRQQYNSTIGSWFTAENAGRVLAGFDTKFEDYNISFNSTYRYWILALSNTGVRSPASEVKEISSHTIITPPAPTDKIKARAGSLEIAIEHKQYEHFDFDYYIIERREAIAVDNNDGTYSIPGIPNWDFWKEINQSNDLAIIDQNVSVHKCYQYRYKIVSLTGIPSDYNSSVNASNLSDPVIPKAANSEQKEIREDLVEKVTDILSSQLSIDNKVRTYRFHSSQDPKYHIELGWLDSDNSIHDNDIWEQYDTGRTYLFNGVTGLWTSNPKFDRMLASAFQSLTSDGILSPEEKITVDEQLKIIAGNKIIIDEHANITEFPELSTDKLAYQTTYEIIYEYLMNLRTGILREMLVSSDIDSAYLDTAYEEVYSKKNKLLESLSNNIGFFVESVSLQLRLGIDDVQTAHQAYKDSGYNQTQLTELTNKKIILDNESVQYTYLTYPTLSAARTNFINAKVAFDTVWTDFITNPADVTQNENLRIGLLDLEDAVFTYQTEIESYIRTLTKDQYSKLFFNKSYFIDFEKDMIGMQTFFDYVLSRSDNRTRIFFGNTSNKEGVLASAAEGDFYVDLQANEELIKSNGLWTIQSNAKFLRGFIPSSTPSDCSIFILNSTGSNAPTVYNEGDILIPVADVVIDGKLFQAHNIYTTVKPRSTSFVSLDWYNKIEYRSKNTGVAVYDIFYGRPSEYKKNDLWIPNDNYVVENELFLKHNIYLCIADYDLSIKYADWIQIADYESDFEKLQLLVDLVQETTNNKNSIFVADPKGLYKKDDIFIPEASVLLDGVMYTAKDMYIALFDGNGESFKSSDWKRATRFADELDDLVDDNKLTAPEKRPLYAEWQSIQREYFSYTNKALALNLDSTAYQNAYGNLNNYLFLNDIFSNFNLTTEIDGPGFRNLFAQYYNEKRNLDLSISNKLNADIATLQNDPAISDKLPPTGGDLTSATPNDDGTVTLSWTRYIDTDSGVNKYEVYRSIDPSHTDAIGIGTVLHVEGQYLFSFIDVTAINQITYYYAIVAYDKSGNKSDYSTWKSATAFNKTPAAPTNFTAVAVPADINIRGYVLLSWDRTDQNVVAYKVFKSDDGGSSWGTESVVDTNRFYDYIGSENDQSTWWVEASELSTWRYKIQAINIFGGVSAETILETAPNTLAYGTFIPTNVPEIAARAERGFVHVNWTPNYSKRIVEYILEWTHNYGTAEETWTQVRIGSNKFDDVLPDGILTTEFNNSYRYRVKAVNAYGKQSSSFITSGVVDTTDFLSYQPTAVPSNISSVEATRGKITITLPLYVFHDSFSYVLEESSDKGLNYSEVYSGNTRVIERPLGIVEADDISIVDKRYRWKIRTIYGRESSYCVGIASVSTLNYETYVPTTTGISVTSKAIPKSIIVSWTNSSDDILANREIDSYLIEVATDGVNYSTIGYVTGNEYMYPIIGNLEANIIQNYRFRVKPRTIHDVSAVLYATQANPVDTTEYGTFIPTSPTIVVSGSKRTINVTWDLQSNLMNLSHYEVQISRDNLTWYKPNILAKDDTDSWYIGSENDSLIVKDERLIIPFLPIPLIGYGSDEDILLPLEAGQVYYIRVKRVTTENANATSATVNNSYTVTPTLYSDLAAKQIKEANIGDYVITARHMTVGSVLAGSLNVSNLDVDFEANIINVTAAKIFTKEQTNILMPADQLISAGNYALNYFDLDTGRFRVGTVGASNKNQYLYINPQATSGTFFDLTGASGDYIRMDVNGHLNFKVSVFEVRSTGNLLFGADAVIAARARDLYIDETDQVRQAHTAIVMSTTGNSVYTGTETGYIFHKNQIDFKVGALGAGLDESAVASVLSILGTGIGIGGSPDSAYKVEIIGGTGATETALFQIRSNASTDNTATTLRFANSTGARTHAGAGEITTLRTAGDKSEMIFRISDGATIVERLRINSIGVGIFNNNPTEALHVKGNILASGSLILGNHVNLSIGKGVGFLIGTQSEHAFYPYVTGIKSMNNGSDSPFDESMLITSRYQITFARTYTSTSASTVIGWMDVLSAIFRWKGEAHIDGGIKMGSSGEATVKYNSTTKSIDFIFI